MKVIIHRVLTFVLFFSTVIGQVRDKLPFRDLQSLTEVQLLNLPR